MYSPYPNRLKYSNIVDSTVQQWRFPPDPNSEWRSIPSLFQQVNGTVTLQTHFLNVDPLPIPTGKWNSKAVYSLFRNVDSKLQHLCLKQILVIAQWALEEVGSSSHSIPLERKSMSSGMPSDLKCTYNMHRVPLNT